MKYLTISDHIVFLFQHLMMILMLQFNKQWKILISVSWLFSFYWEFVWLKNDVQCEFSKIIIQLQIELEIAYFSKLLCLSTFH